MNRSNSLTHTTRYKKSVQISSFLPTPFYTLEERINHGIRMFFLLQICLLCVLTSFVFFQTITYHPEHISIYNESLVHTILILLKSKYSFVIRTQVSHKTPKLNSCQAPVPAPTMIIDHHNPNPPVKA